MRTYIFTETERDILETYLRNGIKLNGFSILISRIKENQPKLLEDVEIIKKTLEGLVAS